MTYKELPVTRILAELEKYSLLPAIIFRSSRAQCDADIEQIYKAKRAEIDTASQVSLREEIERIMEKYGMDRSSIVSNPSYQPLITTACGAHHAGQLLQWRLLLEELMTRNKLRLMIATGTVAAGVDFPARTVVITAHSRPDSEGFKNYSPSEFQQMAGRAGRRGKDKVGFCVVSPGRFCDARYIYKLAKQPPEPLRSAYFASPSTVLNLLKHRTEDDLRFTVDKSLAAFLDRKEAVIVRQGVLKLEKEKEELLRAAKDSEASGVQKQLKKLEKRIRRMYRQAEKLEVKQIEQLNLALAGLKELGYIDEKGLTHKGVWAAALCTNLILILAEAIEEGLFYEASIEELTGLVASIAGDAHRHYYNLSPKVIPKEKFKQLEEVVRRVKSVYLAPGGFEEVEVVPDAANTAIAWSYERDWESFASKLRLARVAEGDAARLILQTSEQLNQLTKLRDFFPDLAVTAGEARALLSRPPLTEGFMLE
ncbi:MAG: hypothetical protein D6780_05590 [Candidatus Dadabacteria bacterium]|nr:MAG: hypothetical protein D6780_05590 [Candidatus Dadabacteria bacterium]